MPTLAAAEQKLAGRAGLYLATAGINYVPVAPAPASPVPAFADAIGEALAACGVHLDDPSAPSDADVQNLSGLRWWKFLDIAELRLLETAAGGLANRAQSQRWADYSVQRDIVSFQVYLNEKRKNARLKWNYGVAPLSAGTVDLNFVRNRGREL